MNFIARPVCSEQVVAFAQVARLFVEEIGDERKRWFLGQEAPHDCGHYHYFTWDLFQKFVGSDRSSSPRHSDDELVSGVYAARRIDLFRQQKGLAFAVILILVASVAM